MGTRNKLYLKTAEFCIYIARLWLSAVVMGLCDCDCYYHPKHPAIIATVALVISPNTWW